MKLSSEASKISNPTWDLVEKELRSLDGKINGFVTLANEDNDFVQVAGNQEHLTVEYRTYLETGFKHYVLGLGGNKSPLRVTWISLDTAIGNIQIHKEEVMNIEDAIAVFKKFFLNESLPDRYNKRNITKLFK